MRLIGSGSTLTVLAGLAAVSACGAPEAAVQTSTVTDSAGVRIVESVRPSPAEPALRIDPEPLFRIGWGENDPPFERLVAGYVRGDERALIVDSGANALYLLDADGSLVTQIGRAGQGPGEFSRMGALIVLPGDSFLISDGGNQRVSIFAGTEHVSDMRFESFIAPALYDPFGRSADGTYWVGPNGFIPSLIDQNTAAWLEMPLLRTTEFQSLDTVLALPFMQIPGNENPIRHSGQMLFAGGSVAHVTTDVAQVTWLHEDGSPKQIARWDAEPKPVTSEHWDAYEAGFRERTSNRDQARIESTLADREPVFGGTLPLFRWAIPARTGGLWLIPYDVATSGLEAFFVTRYEVVSADGVHLGEVTFPQPIRIIDVTEDRVLGIEYDDFEVHAAVMYRLNRGGR